MYIGQDDEQSHDYHDHDEDIIHEEEAEEPKFEMNLPEDWVEKAKRLL